MIKRYTEEEVLHFLRKNAVMNIAVMLEDRPISSVVLFHVDDDFTFYFATRSNTYKVKALEYNSHISLSVWEHFQMFVQVDGIATKIKEEDVEGALEKICLAATNIKDFWPPILHIEGGEYVVYSINPNWVRVMDISSVKISENEYPFQTLLKK